MRPRAHIARRLLATAASAGAVAWLAAACADRITGPGEELVPLAITDQQRSALAAGLTFAAHGGSAMAGHGDAAALATAFDRLVERIDRNDARGARRALEDARAALDVRRAGARDPLAQMEVERMALALEHVALLVNARAGPPR